MGIKTTITPASRADAPYETGSLWAYDIDGPDMCVYVLMFIHGKWVALSVDNLYNHWIAPNVRAHEVIDGLVPFHGKVVIELGGE